LVLTGHDLCIGVTPPANGLTNMVIAVDDLASILGALRDQGYRFVGLAEFLQARRRSGIALLTFDDAYRSLADLAQPLLVRLGIPAVVFAVTGGLLGRGDPFPHFMHELQDKWSTLPPAARAAIDGHPAVKTVVARAALTSIAELLPLETAHDAFANAVDPAGLADLAAFLTTSAGLRRRTMMLDDMRHLLRAGPFELGAHSLTHRAFVSLDNETIEREIVESTAFVADLVGKPPASIGFAYPYGFVTAHAALVVGRHCAAGFTCHERPLSPLDRSPMLPRVNLDSRTLAIARPRWPILESLREETLLYARTDFGRRVTRPVRALLRAVR
jgi:peptidoglycan/xylan/chitin deacetylase (PgdA/CDA1 family)